MAKTTLRYALIWVLIGLPIEGGAAPFFMGLGDLLGGGFRSSATDVSFDGSTVVGESTSSGTEAFRWSRNTGMVGLGYLPGGGLGSGATGVSANGSVIIGRAASSQGAEAFRWTASTGMVGLGDLPGGVFHSLAWGVSADGSTIVGGSETDIAPYEAFRWTASTGMVGLGFLPTASFFNSQAYAISADGSTIVGWSASTPTSGTEAFRWTASAGMVGLGDLPGSIFDSAARGVSGDGSVVVGYSRSALGPVGEAFRWTAAEGMVGLGGLPGSDLNSATYAISAANAVSADGSIIVGSGLTALGQEAFIWDIAHGMRNLLDVLVTEFGLNLAGWSLTSAESISGDGQTIVGYGINPDGFTEAWIAYIGQDSNQIPVPTILALFSLGLGILAFQRAPAISAIPIP